MSSRKIATQIRLDEDLYESLKVIAEKEMRSVNAQMEYFIKCGVDYYKSLPSQTFNPYFEDSKEQ